MPRPFFSVVIPTKNRANLLTGAFDSVGRQSFEDYELILVDNDDSDETLRFAATVNLPQFRQIRTGGLSMADNWQAGIDAASGEYLVLLYDKMRLKEGALAEVFQHLKSRRSDFLTWRSQGIIEGEIPANSKPESGLVHEINCRELLEEAASGRWKSFNRVAPRGVNGAIRRDKIAEIQNNWKLNFSRPGTPDYVMATMSLLSTKNISHLDRVLVNFLLEAPSNGRDALAKRVDSESIALNMGVSLEYLSENVPVKFLSSNNVIYNDFVRVCKECPTPPQDLEIDWSMYYFSLLDELDRMHTAGTETELEDGKFLESLQRESLQIRWKLVTHILRDAVDQSRLPVKESALLKRALRRLRFAFRSFR